MQASTITDQDIDAILARGIKETEELNNKMKEYTEKAMNFTMDGGFNAYEFREEDDAADNVDYKQLIGASWGLDAERGCRLRACCSCFCTVPVSWSCMPLSGWVLPS